MATTLKASDIFPQLQNEPDVVYGVRSLYNKIPMAVSGLGGEVYNTLASAFDTPAARKKRATQQPQSTGGFPVAYTDEAYSAADLNASKITGVPVDLLNRLRLQGERSNADQVSSAGAKTPYQITPQTRAGIMKNYGLDPWSSPQNAALGAAYVAWEQAGRPKPTEWNDQVKARAVGGYFGGAAGAANPFGSISDGNNTVGQYTQRVLGPNTGLTAPFLNPYDPSADQAALGEISKERQALMTPSAFSIPGPGAAPALPKPEPIPTTDFSMADKALANMAPNPMTDAEIKSRQRDGFWKGISQAMMSMSGNEGLGTFLMKLGGAAIAGRQGARDDIRKEQDRFDEKMAQYNAAIFQNETGKAQVHAREAQAQVLQNNNYAMDNWKVAYDRWKGATGSVDISGTNAVLQRKDENGNILVNVLPIQGAVNAMIARQRAEVFQSMGGRQFAGNQQIAGMENALIGRRAIESMTGGAGGGNAESDAAAVAAPAAYATFLATHGGVADVLGPDGAKSLEENVQKQLMHQQLVPGSKDWIDRHDMLISTELTKLGLASPEIMKKMMAAGAAMSSFRMNEALDQGRTRTSTDWRGRTTTTETMPSAASVFTGGQ